MIILEKTSSGVNLLMFAWIITIAIVTNRFVLNWQDLILRGREESACFSSSSHEYEVYYP
jgi:hypothetical protein